MNNRTYDNPLTSLRASTRFAATLLSTLLALSIMTYTVDAATPVAKLEGHVDVLLSHEARPEDRQHFRDLATDRRPVVVSVRNATDTETRTITVSYRGPLEREKLQSLVQSVLASDSDFWSGKRPVQLSMSGDTHRIAVMRYWWVAPLESAGSVRVYTWSGGSWNYMYSSGGWLS